MGIKKVPHRSYSPDLAPCDFWLFPKLRACRYETIEKMKEAVTKVIVTLAHEDFPGAFQKLLERYNKCILAGGLEFHVCTINKSAHMKKVWKLIVCTSIYPVPNPNYLNWIKHIRISTVPIKTLINMKFWKYLLNKSYSW